MSEPAVAVPKIAILDARVVQIETLHPNPWNPNRQNPQTFKAVKESIERYGFLDPCTVRPHPTKKGKLVGEGGDGSTEDEWQIIDSEHRVRAAGELGHTELPINNVGSVVRSDADAKRLTVILNEATGDPELVLLGKLLADLQQGDDLAGLMIGLPYSQREMEELIKIGKVDWDEFDQSAHDQVRQFQRQSRASQYTEFLSFTKEQREKFRSFVEMLTNEWEDGITLEEVVLRALEIVSKAR